jgi:asparagine synthase (glutamine-hydrolysing)
MNDDLKQKLYAPDFRSRVSELTPLAHYARHIKEVPASRERLAGLLHADTSFYLPNDMLVKVDRMSMANSLEVRVPFLDETIVRYCATLPGHYKLRRDLTRKFVLRESLRGAIPPSSLSAPKSGFNIPVEQWMRGTLRSLLFDCIESVRIDLSRFFRIEKIVQLADDHQAMRTDGGHALFVILMFSLWLDNVAKRWKAGNDGDKTGDRQSIQTTSRSY